MVRHSHQIRRIKKHVLEHCHAWWVIFKDSNERFCCLLLPSSSSISPSLSFLVAVSKADICNGMDELVGR
jgi:hypothetical protein